MPDGNGAQHKHELSFASEQDMQAGRPSREVVDGNIPSKKNSIEYTYDDNGRLTKQTEISGDGKELLQLNLTETVTNSSRQLPKMTKAKMKPMYNSLIVQENLLKIQNLEHQNSM